MSEHAQGQTAQQPAPRAPLPGHFQVQRKCACGTYGNGGECEKCRGAQRTARAAATPVAVPPIVQDVVSSPGQPLETGIRSLLEPRFGHDFSHVRVHTDQRAAESADAVRAFAYAVGSDLVFGAGRYEPRTERGSRLLAHELTHVVQQSRGSAAIQPAKPISDPSDSAEVEADFTAQRVLSGEKLKITQSPSATLHAFGWGEGLAIGGGAALVGLGIAWLAGAFDKEHFSDAELSEYLTRLATTRRIAGGTIGDNKARDVVRRWTARNAAFNIDNGFRADGGSLTGVELKCLLIREMLDGPTLGADESAIIEILRRSADRQQIVNEIGRNEIWGDFSGQNRRIVEAITLTDSDFSNPALADRLKALTPDELADYRDNAVDPAVRARIETILQLQRITTPLDINTPIDQAGAAHPVIAGFEVSVMPDTTSPEEKYRNQAFTSLGMDIAPAVPDAFQDESGVVQSSTVPGLIHVTIQTTYGPGADPAGQSAYGRGSTSHDVSAGTTSLRFHEGNHGLDYLEFLRANPAPQFPGQLGITTDQWRQANDQFRRDVDAYYARAIQFSLQRTECVGNLIPPAVAQQYYHNASICATVGGGQ